MTGRNAGVLIHPEAVTDEPCRLIRIWCEAHQLELVVEYIMSEVVSELFSRAMTAFISHLVRQENLIFEMDSAIDGYLRTRRRRGLRTSVPSYSGTSRERNSFVLHRIYGNSTCT